MNGPEVMKLVESIESYLKESEMMGQKQVMPATPTTPTHETSETGGDETSTVLVTPRYSAQAMKVINDCMQQLLAFSGRAGEKTANRLFRMAIKHVIPQAYEPYEDILIKGDPCSGIYFLVEGTVTVVTEDGENIIATLMPGQFFGEVSSVYKIPVTARVRAETRCQCFVLEEDHVWSILPNSTKPVDIIDWFVARKYIPTSNTLECQRIYRRTLLYAFVELPLFKGWSESSVKDLILNLTSESVILYPPNSYIVCHGDPGHAAHILLRGRAMISGKSGLKVETTGLKYPIVIGESGLFLKTRSVLTVKTVTECQVVSVRLDHILATIEEDPVYCSGAWDIRKQLWEEYVQHQSPLGDVPEDSIQFEVIFQYLSNSFLFSNSTLPLLDHLTRESEILQIPDGQLAYSAEDSKERNVLLVVGGQLELVESLEPSTSVLEDIQTVTRGQIIAKIRGMPSKVTYKSVGKSYVIKYSTTLLKRTLYKFSQSKQQEPP